MSAKWNMHHLHLFLPFSLQQYINTGASSAANMEPGAATLLTEAPPEREMNWQQEERTEEQNDTAVNLSQ